MQSTEKFTNLNSVKERFDYVLKLAGWSPAEAARRLPASPSYISLILSGKRDNLGADFLSKCASIGVPTDWLQHGAGDPPKVIQSTVVEAELSHFTLEHVSEESLVKMMEDVISKLRDAGSTANLKRKALDNLTFLTMEWRHRLREVSSQPTSPSVSPEVAKALGASVLAKKLAQELPPKQGARETSGHKPLRAAGAPPEKK